MSYIIGGSILVILIWGVYALIATSRLAKSNDSNTLSENTEFSQLEISATVVDMACGASLVGMKTPKSVKEFIIVFENTEGEILKFSVPEEMYHGFDIGQRGRLTLIDGQVYGFEME